MLTRDYRDIIGGISLLAIGLYAGVYAATEYTLGSVQHMGPGMFPAALGFLLAALGAAIALPAFFRPGMMPRPEIRPLIATAASIVLFAVTIRNAGLVPAVILLTVVAALGDNKLSWLATALLSVILSIFAVLIFIVGLDMPLQLFIWPNRWL